MKPALALCCAVALLAALADATLLRGGVAKPAVQ